MNTHDMVQGQRMGDRIGVMMKGMIVQSETPKEIFTLPDPPHHMIKIAGVMGQHPPYS